MNERELVASALLTALDEQLTKDAILQLLENPKSVNHGDVAFPCFTLAKLLRQSPQKIAVEICEKLPKEDFEKVEVAGPYLNFFLDKKKVSNSVLKNILSKKEQYGTSSVGNGQTIVLDMSSPNIAKPFSMGHLRSTVIGHSLSKIYEKMGYQTVKINHLGDWGKQFGLLMSAYKKWGVQSEIEKAPIAELLKLYVRINKEAKEDVTVDEEGRAWFKKLEDGDKEASELWQWFRKESLQEFSRIYDRLGVTFDSYNGEAFYNDKMTEVVEMLEEKGLLTESDGASIVELEQFDLNPALIKKSDGATLYMTRDLAAAIYRKRTYDFSQAFYVVGAEQTVHFKQLRAVLHLLGFSWAEDLVHIPFGLITQGGKKLSTREGKIILLEEVLDEADELALSQIEAKNPSLPDKEKVAHMVGTGAVIFHDLKNDRMNQFDFDLKEVVQFEGETGPYVQYTRARSLSILRKSTIPLDETVAYHLDDPYSWEVVKLLQDFPNQLSRAMEKQEPSILAKYAIHLSQAFNKYYANVRILDEDEALTARLALVSAVAITLKEALRLLGVQAPEEM